ncbi:MAG: hydantoinase/oxoprolinase family protein [Halolamina sp.]
MTEGAGRVGVDVGGTFTDVVTVRDGRVDVEKVPSTPADPAGGVLDGLDAALAGGGSDEEGASDASADAAATDAGGLAPDAVAFLGHGTTVATNAVLEGEFAETALLTTAGFRDVLEIGRQDRPDIYDFAASKPDPVVPRDRRYEVAERVDERGEVLEPLADDEVRALADDLRDVDAVAVSLLFPFENDAHERRIRELLGEEGVDAAVSLSSVVLPEIREYERTLTTALNAALKPRMAGYIGRLADGVADRGVGAPVELMQSNGGMVAAEAARERPVDTLLSGPAAGVQGATFVAGRRGVDDIVTMDMGGTSCDVALVEDGDPPVTTDTEVGDYPVSVPAVDIHTVGAGGGSVAWVDDGGALRVGPKSAGAEPGPVCYGRGGERPTITDAHLLLGRLNPEAFLAEEVGTDEDDVRAALERDVADPLGVGVEAAAAGIVEVANANMERALRVVSVERGHDPRNFSLVAYGGAGPLHAPALAESLGIPEVVVPRTAGVLSALGLLISDVLYDYSTSRVRRLDAVDPETLAATYADFEAEGRDQLAAEGFDATEMRFERVADLRYVGQSFELSVPVPADLDAGSLADAAERFHERHRQRYGHASPEEPVELVTVRLRARGVVDPPELRAGDGDDDDNERAADADDAVSETRTVVFDGDAYDAPIYDRRRLPIGAAVAGPAVVEGVESTTVVRPGQRATVDDDANLVVEVDADV